MHRHGRASRIVSRTVGEPASQIHTTFLHSGRIDFAGGRLLSRFETSGLVIHQGLGVICETVQAVAEAPPRPFPREGLVICPAQFLPSGSA